MQSANHVVAAQCKKTCKWSTSSRPPADLHLHTKHENGEKCDLGGFDPGIVIVVRQVDLGILETKHLQWVNVLQAKKALLIRDVRG